MSEKLYNNHDLGLMIKELCEFEENKFPPTKEDVIRRKRVTDSLKGYEKVWDNPKKLHKFITNFKKHGLIYILDYNEPIKSKMNIHNILLLLTFVMSFCITIIFNHCSK